MSVVLDFLNGIKPELTEYMYEMQAKEYKKVMPAYPSIVSPIPKDKIIGGYYKTTSAIGINTFSERETYGKYHEDKPQEGFSVYGTLKGTGETISSPMELERDWKHRAESWIRDYVKQNWAPAVEPTKDYLVGKFLARIGCTAGDAIFNQDDAARGISTELANPNLPYDGKPGVALSDNKHTAKNGAAYYNGLAYGSGDLTGVNAVTYELGLCMKKRLIANAFMESGRPFDNTRNPIVICSPHLEDDWKAVNESTLNPDNANNRKNTLQGMIKKIIAFPHLPSTVDVSIMISEGNSILAYFSEAKMEFWEEYNPKKIWASISLDYILTLKNFRQIVGVNCPTS